MPGSLVRALRGATTVEEDTPEQVAQRTLELLARMMEVNDLTHDDLISILFTATGDIVSMFPATAARSGGFGDVPLLCASEIPVVGSMPRCIRVMAHIYTDRSPTQLHHVYLYDAQSLRDDLPA